MTVEFALIAPLLFLLILVLIEMSRANMAMHSLQEAAREGCRTAILSNTSTEDVQNKMNAILISAGIPPDRVDIDITNLAGNSINPGDADQWEPVTVTVSAAYNDLNWVPVPRYFGGLQLSASITLPREAGGP